MNKGKRYIRLKLPSQHRKQLWEPLPAACPACLSRGQPSHLRVLRRRSGGGSSSHALQGRLTSPESRGESVGPRIHLPLKYRQNTVTLSTTGSEVAGGVTQAPHPHLRAHVGTQCESAAQHAWSSPLHWPPFCVRGKETEGNVEVCLSHSVVALTQECRAR